MDYSEESIPAGHMNERNFVGLSATADGYIACGSEDNAVYTYYKTLPMPLASHAFEPAGDNRPEVWVPISRVGLDLWVIGGCLRLSPCLQPSMRSSDRCP